jgi:hypothetical protein
VNGPLKATLGLAAFVVVLGAVLWATTGEVYFVAFIVLGLLTGGGAWFTGRTAPPPSRPGPGTTSEGHNP